jgi:arsenate reductase (thioredoxin)
MKTTVKAIVIVLCLTLMSSFTKGPKIKFAKQLSKYCKTLANDFDKISEERKNDLIEMGDYIITKRVENKKCNLLFICTSNSRRSHMAQIWAYTASLYYGVDSIFTFSGGTEATKVNINAISAIRRCGFSASTSDGGDNPVWTIGMGANAGQFLIFSKKYAHSQNPKTDFGAFMVCSQADKSCPVVEGADIRIALPYDDPKYFDNTPSQDQKYDERCRQIATDMFFMFDYVKQKLILKSESKS